MPTLDSLGITSRPVYLRKLRKKRAWEPPDAGACAESVFPDRTNSLFRVGTEEDLYKVGAALNSGKDAGGIDNEGFFLWLRGEELKKFGILLSPAKNEDRINCLAAQRLHLDAAADSAMWRSLCGDLKSCGRSYLRITRGQMKSINYFLRSKGCWSYPENKGAKCELCPWATGWFMGVIRRLVSLFPK